MTGPALSARRAAQLRAVGTAFLRLRPLVVGPLMALALGLLWLGGAPGRQLAALGAAFAVFLGMFTWEAVRGRRRLVGEQALFASLVVTVLGISLGCAATGGLRSPLLPMLFAPTVITFAAFGRSSKSLILLGLLSAIAIGLRLLPEGVPFSAVPAIVHGWLMMASLVDAALLLFLGVTRLSDAYAQATEALARSGEDVLEAAAARARALEALGAKVAHEIKNPLAAVKGLVEVMAEGDAAGRDRKRLEVVRGEVARIEDILQQYLSFSRPLEAMRPEPVDVGRVAGEVLAVLEARAAQRGVDLEGAGTATQVEADPRRLKEALLNLLSNALEATPPGGRVRVGWAPDGAGARLTVEDTGRGMDAAMLERLGQPFFSTRDGGTGLGVLLARQVAEQHGGALSFDSAPGRGTTATLTLPARPRGHADDPSV